MNEVALDRLWRSLKEEANLLADAEPHLSYSIGIVGTRQGIRPRGTFRVEPCCNQDFADYEAFYEDEDCVHCSRRVRIKPAPVEDQTQDW